MIRTALLLAAGLGLGVGGMSAAQHDEKKHGSVKPLAALDMAEKLDGKDAKATVVEVTLEPGQAGAPHRHPGPVLGYVLEGEYGWAIDDRPATVLKAGETLYEPAGCLHRVSKNPGKVKARVLAWVLHPRDAQTIVIPEPNPDPPGRPAGVARRGCTRRKPRTTRPARHLAQRHGPAAV